MYKRQEDVPHGENPDVGTFTMKIEAIAVITAHHRPAVIIMTGGMMADQEELARPHEKGLGVQEDKKEKDIPHGRSVL